MTAATVTPTATSPSVRDIWRMARGPLLIGGVLVLLAVVIAVTTPRGRAGALDPAAVDPGGAHALASLLEAHGVDVTRVTTPRAVTDRAGPDTTVVIAQSAFVPGANLRSIAATGSDLVLLEPTQLQIDALGLGATVTGESSVATREPGCAFGAAVLAGPAQTGGLAYATSEGTADKCYHAAHGATLLHVNRDGRSITLFGSAVALTNDRLDNDGDAALGLDVLGSTAHVVWLVPDLSALARAGGGHRSIASLLPDSVWLVVGELAVAVVLLGVWRARRLGAVVAEPLPVVVRAAETVEGRARLYRAARARSTAAEALRSAVRERLSAALGLGRDADPASVTAAVAERTGRDPGALHVLLYGAADPDLTDAALVMLADELDALGTEVRSS